jgi:dipeptidyl aminopeptidase/acylaminoacyl peptidase
MSLAASRLIRSQVALGDPTVSRDGHLVAYSRRTVEGNEYRTRLWVVAAGGGRPRQLTDGPVDDSAPVFSGDGAHVLFLRERQVHRVALSGGVAEKLTSLAHGIDAFALSPDGRQLLLTGPAPELRFAVGPSAGEKPPLARVLRRVDWRLDGSGFLDRHAHLWVAPARRGGRARRILTGDVSAESAIWSPDGRQVAYVSDPDDDSDLHHRTRVFALAADGEGSPVEVASLAGACRTPAWSPDGAHIAFRGIDEEDEPFGARETVWVVPSRGGEPRDLAPDVHVEVAPGDGSDLIDWRRDGAYSLAWDGPEVVVCPVTERGRTTFWRFPLDGAPSEQPGCGAHVLRGAFESDLLVLLVPGTAGAAELAVAEREMPRRLTRHGSAWAGPLAGVTTEQVDVPGPAGPIRTWVVSPADAEGPLPTVLSIIGGPGASWGPIAWLPDLALADRGYRVLRPDPRGSGSYGRAWTEAILGSWGGADAEDQLAVCDWAVAAGLADPDRLAVHGLSYGGYMTNWLVGQTDRFRAAVSANGVTNQVSAVANCDLGLLWTPRLGWEYPPDGMELLWAQSPLAHADRITTPLLMLQGADDLRCPAADNEQLFSALRVRGREVEYVLYPEESHVMQATGRPDRRIDMLERTLAWFERFGCSSQPGSQ